MDDGTAIGIIIVGVVLGIVLGVLITHNTPRSKTTILDKDSNGKLVGVIETWAG